MSNNFTSLFFRLQLNVDQFRNPNNGEVPYDVCCPSIRELLASRTCSRCGNYFASAKNLKLHKKACSAAHSALNVDSNGSFLLQRRENRPVRLAARRQRERMIVWTSRLNDEHIEWVDEDDLQGVEVEESEASSIIQSIVERSISEHLNVPWENV